ELRRWLRFDAEASVIVHEHTGATASASALVGEVVELLVDRGIVDRGFFARLRDARPRRAAEIDQVAALWQTRRAATPSPPGRQDPAAPASPPPVVQSGGIFAPGATFN